MNYQKDWLALAPVFTDNSTNGLSLKSQNFMQNMDEESQKNTRASFMNGAKINPLPASEVEVNEIFKEFNLKNRSALVKSHSSTTESFVKSGILSEYKYIHFATHGFVNSDSPELSGILLAPDTTGGNDGILFSGEIYNLNLNADLVVLSACETGLGKLSKGEGIIGLSRALLFAGTNNIIVSLWQVADKSTSDLMIHFYDNLLVNEKKKIPYAQSFREAKLKLIENNKYAHPYFWSPFILIGQ